MSERAPVKLDYVRDILPCIGEVRYDRIPGTTITVCTIDVLRDGKSVGFPVTGQSACVCDGQFNAQFGEEAAFKQATNKIWELEGYRLAHRIIEQGDHPATYEG